MESDSTEAVEAITFSGVLVNPYLDLVRDIRQMILFRIEVKFQLVAREANSVADILAKSARMLGFGAHILHFPMTECRSLLFQDATEALASLYAPAL